MAFNFLIAFVYCNREDSIEWIHFVAVWLVGGRNNKRVAGFIADHLSNMFLFHFYGCF